MRLEAESEEDEEEGAERGSEFLLQLDPGVRQMISKSRRAALGTREAEADGHSSKVCARALALFLCIVSMYMYMYMYMYMCSKRQ